MEYADCKDCPHRVRTLNGIYCALMRTRAHHPERGHANCAPWYAQLHTQLAKARQAHEQRQAAADTAPADEATAAPTPPGPTAIGNYIKKPRR